MTGYGSMIGSDISRMRLSVTPHAFAAAVGVLLFLAGLVMLLIPATATFDDTLFGATDIPCGSALVSDVSEVGGSVCDDALKTNRLAGWPLGIVGAVVVAGALFVQTPGQRRE